MFLGYLENSSSFIAKNIKRSVRRNPKLLLSDDFFSETIYINNMTFSAWAIYLWALDWAQISPYPRLQKVALYAWPFYSLFSQPSIMRWVCSSRPLPHFHPDFNSSLSICFPRNLFSNISGTSLNGVSILSQLPPLFCLVRAGGGFPRGLSFVWAISLWSPNSLSPDKVSFLVSNC